MKKQPPDPRPIVFPRADPAALATFDPSTKVCTMGCGPHSDDPRTDKERKFLCDDCVPAWPRPPEPEKITFHLYLGHTGDYPGWPIAHVNNELLNETGWLLNIFGVEYGHGLHGLFEKLGCKKFAGSEEYPPFEGKFEIKAVEKPACNSAVKTWMEYGQ